MLRCGWRGGFRAHRPRARARGFYGIPGLAAGVSMGSPGSRPGFLWDPRARARGFYGIPGLAPGVSMGSPGSRPGFLWDPRARGRGFYGIPGLAPGVSMGSPGSRPGFLWRIKTPGASQGTVRWSGENGPHPGNAGRGRGCPCYLDGVGNRPEPGWRRTVSIERAGGRMPEASVRRDGTGNPDQRKVLPQLAGGLADCKSAPRPLAQGSCTQRKPMWLVPLEISPLPRVPTM